MIKAYAIHYVLNAKLSFIYKTNKDAKMSWISVCQQDDITEDEPKAIEVEGKKIGVFFIDDNYFAIENVCPHAFALLTEGFIEDQTVECPFTRGNF